MACTERLTSLFCAESVRAIRSELVVRKPGVRPVSVVCHPERGKSGKETGNLVETDEKLQYTVASSISCTFAYPAPVNCQWGATGLCSIPGRRSLPVLHRQSHAPSVGTVVLTCVPATL